MTTGLVLEGGAMRALYTAGILDVWMDEGIRVDALFGTSAGAIFGAAATACTTFALRFWVAGAAAFTAFSGCAAGFGCTTASGTPSSFRNSAHSSRV